MSFKRWRCVPVLVLVLAACPVAPTFAASVADDATLKSAGRDPDIPLDILKIHGEINRVLESPDANNLIENRNDHSRTSETIGDDLSQDEKIIGVSDAERSVSRSVEKPVFQIPPFVSPGLHISEQEDKLRDILMKKITNPAKFKSKIKNKSSDLTSQDAQIPGVGDASRASIDGHGASGRRLAPSDASYQRRATAGHADATLVKSGREVSASVSSVLPVPTDRHVSLIHVPRASLDYEYASQNVMGFPSGSEVPSASMSGIVSGPEAPNDSERKQKVYSENSPALAKPTSKLGKKRLAFLKKNIFRRKVGTPNDVISKRYKHDSLIVESNLSRRVTDLSDEESYPPALQSYVISSDRFPDSNVKVHLKDESLLEDALLVNDDGSESDAEVESNIVKRSTSDSPGMEENPSNFLDQEGPTGHVMHLGIMENFAGDFTSPVDLQFSDDYFNHEPYHYDIYYDDSMNSDFPNDEDFDVADMEKPRSASETSAQNFPWEDEIDENDATETIDGNFEDVENTLELRLLGPDFQSELGYVLERLANDSQQRSRRHQVPVRHEDPRYSEGISVGVIEGTCPPPVHSLPPGLCLAPPCTSHMMCYPQKMCCFNGCTYTCTEPVQPPPVVDWLEDSDIRLPILDPLNPALPLRFESSPLSYGTGGGETVRLPGGCSLSAAKYEELKQFMTAESIQDCLCSGGEVVCVVKSSPNN